MEKEKEWIELYGTAFKHFVKEKGYSERGIHYTVMSKIYCRKHDDSPLVCIKKEKRYHSEMTDRGRLGTYYDEITLQCPICKKEYKTTENHTEKDESYCSNEERRVYNILD